MKPEERLRRVFALLLEAVKKDANLAGEIDRVLTEASNRSKGERTPASSRYRRKPATFDPFLVYQDGEAALRSKLGELDLDALKDIVSECGMDSAQLVLKWKTPERVVDHIVNTVQARSRKGDVFRT